MLLSYSLEYSESQLRRSHKSCVTRRLHFKSCTSIYIRVYQMYNEPYFILFHYIIHKFYYFRLFLYTYTLFIFKKKTTQ